MKDLQISRKVQKVWAAKHSIWNLPQVSHLYSLAIILHMMVREVIRRQMWINSSHEELTQEDSRLYPVCKPWGNHAHTGEHPSMAYDWLFWRGKAGDYIIAA